MSLSNFESDKRPIVAFSKYNIFHYERNMLNCPIDKFILSNRSTLLYRDVTSSGRV